MSDDKQSLPVSTPIPASSSLNTTSKMPSLTKPNLRWVRNLVFQGGSVKGTSYGGAVGALEEALKLLGSDLDSQIERVAGTSAGAITALALSLGTEVAELVDTIGNTDFKSFLDTRAYDIVSNISSENSSTPAIANAALATVPLLTTTMGLASGQNVLDYLEQFSEKKTGIKYLTFGELHEMVERDRKEGKKKGRCKDLFVVAYNLTLDEPQVFSYVDTPDSVISDAVRCSMSIPFVFVPHKNYIKKKQSSNSSPVPVKKAKGAKDKDKGKNGDERVEASEDLWIDGGITDNYPIWVFDKLFKHPYDATLGFYLVSLEEKQQIEGGRPPEHVPIRRDVRNILDYAKAVIETVVSSQQTSAHKQGKDIGRTIYIDHLGTNMMNFGLTHEEKNLLVCSGWDSACGRLGLNELMGKCKLIIKTPKEIQEQEKRDQRGENTEELHTDDENVNDDELKKISKCRIC